MTGFVHVFHSFSHLHTFLHTRVPWVSRRWPPAGQDRVLVAECIQVWVMVVWRGQAGKAKTEAEEQPFPLLFFEVEVAALPFLILQPFCLERKPLPLPGGSHDLFRF